MSKNIMSTWKEFNKSSNKSIKDDFQKSKYQYAEEIANYLDKGNVKIVATKCGEDILTGERVAGTYCILSDNVFTCSNTLSHYIRKYNLRLPEIFEQHILSRINISNQETTKTTRKAVKNPFVKIPKATSKNDETLSDETNFLC